MLIFLLSSWTDGTAHRYLSSPWWTVVPESTEVTERWRDASMPEYLLEMSEDAAEPSHPEDGHVAGEVVAEVVPDESCLRAVADGTKEMETKGELLASATNVN